MKTKKTILLTVLLCAVCPMMVFAQLKVDAAGNVGIGSSASNFLGTISNAPIIFKVNNSVAAGYTGYPDRANVSFGYGALSNPLVGNCNVAIGYSALYSNTAGYDNTASGHMALYSNTTGHSNTANGYYALYSNTIGYYNTANGYYTLYSNVNGNHNTANGIYALYNNKTGSTNTASGYYALYTNITGGSNTAIGYYADVNANNLNNATAIGYNAKATASNQVRIGNSSVTSIGGYAAWTNLSDKRAKKNIRADVPGLDFINRLQPVTYNLDLDVVDELLKSDDPEINSFRDSLRMARSPEEKEFEAKAREVKQKQVQTGFLAQDVEKTAQSIGYDFSGVDVDEKGIYGLRYAEFVVPLVKAVQELSEQVTELKAEIEELKAPKHSAKVVIDEGESATVNAPAMEQQAQLFQNTPNPFNQSTQIKFYVPESVSKAFLCIYDLQGRQLKQTAITQRGYGIETVFASEFPAGIYLYALLADGNQVDVKRMILTE